MPLLAGWLLAGLAATSPHLAEPGAATYSSCWGAGFSRALCCPPLPVLPCFSAAAQGGEAVFSAEGCCSDPYDFCFLFFNNEVEKWNRRNCSDYAASDVSWLTRNCLTWAMGDTDFESTVASDVLDSGRGRCFYVEVQSTSRRFSWTWGICTPASCSATDVERELADFVDMTRLTLKAVSVRTASSVRVKELVSWRALGGMVDFVIAGFVNSGTSTLVKTLAANPKVFLESEELSVPHGPLEQAKDGHITINTDWRAWFCADLLPMSWVEEVREKFAKGTGKIRGFKNPLLLYGESCVKHLARVQPGLKILAILRDPLEWLLSIFKRDEDALGHALTDWSDFRSDGTPSRGGMFGRDHGKFGSALQNLLLHFPEQQVLAVELEHLRNHQTTTAVMEAIARFLGIASKDGTSTADAGLGHGQRNSATEAPPALRYHPGLQKQMPRTWDRAELCASTRAPQLKTMAEFFKEEYGLLPKLLARVGVQELGVSATTIAGGAFARHCQQQISLPMPMTRKLAVGEAESLAVEGRIHIHWRGELGFKFRILETTKIGVLGCGAGDGPPKRKTWVTLWDVATKKPMAFTMVGPMSLVHEGYAYGEVFDKAFTLSAGEVYALTLQVSPHLGIKPAKHASIGMAPSLGQFLGGVYSHSPWVFPAEVDENSWEQAYVTLVTLRVID